MCLLQRRMLATRLRWTVVCNSAVQISGKRTSNFWSRSWSWNWRRLCWRLMNSLLCRAEWWEPWRPTESHWESPISVWKKGKARRWRTGSWTEENAFYFATFECLKPPSLLASFPHFPFGKNCLVMSHHFPCYEFYQEMTKLWHAWRMRQQCCSFCAVVCRMKRPPCDRLHDKVHIELLNERKAFEEVASILQRVVEQIVEQIR